MPDMGHVLTLSLGLVAKIRVTDLWQRQGYGTRMVKRAMRDLETYAWAAHHPAVP